MDLLIRLARDGGQVVAKDDLLASVWRRRFVNESALARAIGELRQVLGDTGRVPTHIETVAKRGYRMVAPVDPVSPCSVGRVAVLPFHGDGHTAEEQCFADGMADALIAELGRFSDVRIISHQTTERFRGSTRPLPDIARELQVDAVIEGSVFRTANHVRVTVVLLQPDPEQQLWADSLESAVDDVLAVQRILARTIAYAVHGALASTRGR
jgi:TolB-like protein